MTNDELRAALNQRKAECEMKRDQVIVRREAAVASVKTADREIEVYDAHMEELDFALEQIEAAPVKPMRIALAVPRAKPGEVEKAILDYFGKAPVLQLNADMLATALAPEQKPQSVRQALRRLAKLGDISEHGGLFGAASRDAKSEAAE